MYARSKKCVQVLTDLQELKREKIMLLSCQNIKVEFVTGVVLDSVSFHIERNEKAAIVGINGAGKTTLLRAIVGDLEPDEGIVSFERIPPTDIWLRMLPSTRKTPYTKSCLRSKVTS